MKSLKISEVHNYPNELLKRLRGVNSPGKRKLVQDIKDSNWEAVYEELLYRIELYAGNKVVNYTRKDLAELVINIAKHQPAVLASALYAKNFGTQVLEPEEGIDFLITDEVIAELVDFVEQNLTGAIDEWDGELDDYEITRNLALLAINGYASEVDGLSSDSLVNDPESEYYGKGLLDVIMALVDAEIVDDGEDDEFFITDEVIAELVDFVEQNLPGSVDESDGAESEDEIIRNLSHLAINSYGDDTGFISSTSLVNDPESEYFGEKLLDVIIGIVNADDYYDDDEE